MQSATISVPPNPYKEPMLIHMHDLQSIKFEAPWLPQLIEYLVLGFLIILFSVLFCTVGIIAQVELALRRMIVMTSKRIRPGTSIENSAYGVSIGIFSIFMIPLWLLQLPFRIVGWAWSHSTVLGLIASSIIFIIIWYTFISSGSIQNDIILPIVEWSRGIDNTLAN